MPVYGVEELAGGDQGGPEFVEEAQIVPALKSTVNAGVIAELLGQMVPLTARSHSENDAVEGFAGVDALASPRGSGIMGLDQFVKFLP